MTLSFRHIRPNSINVVLVSLFFGVVYVTVSIVNVPPRPFWTAIIIALLAFFSFAFLAATVSVLRLRFTSFASYLVSATIGYASIIGGVLASAALKGDSFEYPGPVHAEIANAFRQGRSTTGIIRPGITDISPELIALGEDCHPPNGCECWIARDVSDEHGIERDVGGWHEPISTAFPRRTSPNYFAVVSVRRMEKNVYSVIGCTHYWGSMWLKPWVSVLPNYR